MAGTDPRFNSTTFRDAIHFAMTMGQAELAQDFIEFQWSPKRTFSPADPGGSPLVWSETPLTTDTHAPVVIKCAYEFAASGLSATRLGGTGLGIFDTGNVTVTVLDVDYLSLFDSHNRFVDKAVIGPTVYEVMFVAPPLGLFDVTVYQIFLQAVDES